MTHENFQLQQVTKSALQETSVANISLDLEQEESNSGDNSLSEQLTNNAQARALKLELENRRLLSMIDSLKEANFQENSMKILDLEKEKKKLTLKCEQLQESCDRLTQQNSELESLFKNALQENRKLQDSLDTAKVISDRQVQDLQNERCKIDDLEKNVDSLTKDKQRVQSLCDSIKKRADDAEKSVLQLTEQIQSLQQQAENCKRLEKLNLELEDRVVYLEKENANFQKEVNKLKELMEVKDSSLDELVEKCDKQGKEIGELCKDKEDAMKQIEKLQEFEKKTQELLSQTAVYTETISTLQKDLISEKVNLFKIQDFKLKLKKLHL